MYCKDEKYITPVSTLIIPSGIPVGVSKAGKSFSATRSAFSRNMGSPVRAKQDNRPPTKRMLISKTDTSPHCLTNEITLHPYRSYFVYHILHVFPQIVNFGPPSPFLFETLL